MPNPLGYPTPDTLRIANALREWMHAARVTQVQLGQRVAVSQSMVSRAVRGLLPADSPAMNKICALAGIPVPAITGEGTPADPAAVPIPLAHAVLRLWDGSPQDAERIARLLDAVTTLRTATPARP